jgi:DNA modification methylase
MNKNKLYYGDNLEILRKYIKDETIDLCYIDPPFNSKRNYNQIYNNIGGEDRAQAQAFVDTWTWDENADSGYLEIVSNHGGRFQKQSISLLQGLMGVLGKDSLLAYLVSMTLRVTEIRRALKPSGSFYFHCDPTASHYVKLLLDSVFVGSGGEFLNEIIWCYKSRHFAKTHFGRKHDNIFFYSKSSKYTFNWRDILRPLSDVTIKKFKHRDEIGPYRLNGRGITGSPIKSAKDVDPKWEKTHPHLTVRDYLKEGVPIEDYWYIEIINQSAKERLGYPTQKPEELLEKIIMASSNKGDVVLDAYCGCGTTVAVSHRLGRTWVGIDITYQSISLILKRLEDSFGKKVIESIELNGVPQDFESAEALAHKKDDRIRKEFEKWAVLTYSNNRAIINEKKGGDGGIDGIAYVADLGAKNEPVNQKVIFSVKSNKTLPPSFIRDLNGTIEREGAVAGILITLYDADNLVKESKKYGTYRNGYYEKPSPKIEVVTVKQLLSGETMNYPSVLSVLKDAEFKAKGNQGKLDL